MHRTIRTSRGRWRCAALSTLALSLGASWGFAQAQAAAPSWTLRQAYESAWSRQPEALALAARRDAVLAQQQASQAWTAEPIALELSNKTDRLSRNLGARELEVGVAVPLWLPGERSRSQAVAQAEARALESRQAAAQLRVAASTREAWWNWQRAHAEADAARAQLDSARRIAADVGRRLKAGDLTRADQHQAEGAVAAAESVLVQAEAALITAQQQLRAITAAPRFVAEPSAADTQAEPEPGASPASLDAHGELLVLQDRAALADKQLALSSARSRANPELTLATTRDRGAFGEAYQQSVTVGVRIPFGGGPRHDVRTATARADAAELQAQLALERARLGHEREAAQARTGAARAQLAAAERRAALARESRGFFDKSFRLGETDLPTRLRIEAEAADAERQAARSRIELAAAISSWRQALGLLPE
jgi:cobalt-zinc-cadmium efflux system outer membrane protein